jgi:hypothetical protein
MLSRKPDVKVQILQSLNTGLFWAVIDIVILIVIVIINDEFSLRM